MVWCLIYTIHSLISCQCLLAVVTKWIPIIHYILYQCLCTINFVCSGYVDWNGVEFSSDGPIPDGMCGYPVTANSAGRYVGVGMNGTKDVHTLQQYSVLEKNANLRQVLNAPLQMAAGASTIQQMSSRIPFSNGPPMQARMQSSEGPNMRLPPAYNQYRFRNFNYNSMPAAGSNTFYPTDIPPGIMRPGMPPTSDGSHFVNQSMPGCRPVSVNGYNDGYIPQRNGYCSNPVMMSHTTGGGFVQHSTAGWNNVLATSEASVQHSTVSSGSSVNCLIQGQSLMSPLNTSSPTIPFTVSKLLCDSC